MSANYYISDELANKVKILTKALFDAEKALSQLQKENEILLSLLKSIDNNQLVA